MAKADFAALEEDGLGSDFQCDIADGLKFDSEGELVGVAQPDSRQGVKGVKGKAGGKQKGV